MSSLPLWLVALVAMGIAQIVLHISKLINNFGMLTLRGRQRPDVAEAYSSSFFDDPPPSYAKACLSPSSHDASPYTEACQPPVLHSASPVQRLQSFIASRLAIDYNLETRPLSLDREQGYFLGLCKKYCMVLGMQFRSRKEVATAKEELIRDVFEPARTLGIPADVMEACLFFTRFFVHDDGSLRSFYVSVTTYPQAVALRMAIDYTVIIDAAVSGTDPSLGSTLKKKCLEEHQRLFPWYLDLETISHEYNEQQEQRSREPSAKESARITTARSNESIIGKVFRRIAAVSNRHIIVNKKPDALLGSDDESSSEDSYTEYSDSDLSDTSPSTADRPSIDLKYQKYSFWPTVTSLARQSWRPCSTLADPRYTQNLCVSRDDLWTWKYEPPSTSFRPRCVKVKPRGFACGLPDKVRIAGMQWSNPDGGSSKMKHIDDEDDCL
ncbi:hypothetical protein QM012_003778 [Aureobasidium pullulans]|uniref:Uncharacterized protein n=1 Tax=Aureobasidium pullulans TaxID=5580 RepID=A0ABR0T8V7_AURPU